MDNRDNGKKPNNAYLISQVSMFFSAIFMGFVGIMVDYLSKFPVYTIVLLRGLFGTFFLTIWLIKTKSFSKKFFKANFKYYWKFLLLLIIIYPLGIHLYFLNIKISGYAVAAFLLYMNGIFLLGILYITKYGEKISKINILSFFIACIGVLIIMEIWKGFLLLESIFFGLGSAIFLAINIFLRKLMYKHRKASKDEGDGNDVAFDTFIAWWVTLTLVIFFLPIGAVDLLKLRAADVLVSIFLGLIPTALAFTLYNIGIKNDKNGNILILAYVEPFVATINSALFLKKLSPFTIIGGALIIVANIIIIKYSKPSME